MKTITIIAEQVTDRALTAALPAQGIESMTVSRTPISRDAVAGRTYRSFRNPDRFAPNYRIELIVDDSAVETVFDGISFAYGAGLFSDAEAWVEEPALAQAA